MSLFDTHMIESLAVESLWKAQLLFTGKDKAELTTSRLVRKTQKQQIQKDPEEQAKDQQTTSSSINCASYADGLATMLSMLIDMPNHPHGVIASYDAIEAVGHRVVHGGPSYSDSMVINDEVVRKLEQYLELAPEHQPANLKGIATARKLIPNAVQVAVFDTAFHQTMPESAKVLAGPYEWYEKYGIRRYGFHGISHKYCSLRAAELLNKDVRDLRMITCHLGAGASLTAIKNGTSIMTTMSYTPLDGLIMKTRIGAIDPGVALHFLHNGTYNADQLNQLLNEEAGLKGISGLSGDMRELLKAVDSSGGTCNRNHRAQLALDMFVDSVAGHIASLIPCLGGLDVLVFTAGIGENSPEVRSLVCKQLEFLGVQLDKQQNKSIAANSANNTDAIISSNQSRITCLVVHTREDLLIARECTRLCNA